MIKSENEEDLKEIATPKIKFSIDKKSVKEIFENISKFELLSNDICKGVKCLNGNIYLNDQPHLSCYNLEINALIAPIFYQDSRIEKMYYRPRFISFSKNDEQVLDKKRITFLLRQMLYSIFMIVRNKMITETIDKPIYFMTEDVDESYYTTLILDTHEESDEESDDYKKRRLAFVTTRTKIPYNTILETKDSDFVYYDSDEDEKDKLNKFFVAIDDPYHALLALQIHFSKLYTSDLIAWEY